MRKLMNKEGKKGKWYPDPTHSQIKKMMLESPK